MSRVTMYAPPALRVRLDRLAVREDQEAEHDQQRSGDGYDEAERSHADGGHGDTEDLLGRVRGRREVVTGEHRERGGLAEPFVREPLGVQRRAEEALLEAVSPRLRQLDRGRGAVRRGLVGRARGREFLFNLH